MVKLISQEFLNTLVNTHIKWLKPIGTISWYQSYKNMIFLQCFKYSCCAWALNLSKITRQVCSPGSPNSFLFCLTYGNRISSIYFSVVTSFSQWFSVHMMHHPDRNATLGRHLLQKSVVEANNSLSSLHLERL